MGKLIYAANTSLDGYLEDETGSIDWSVPDDDVHAFWNEHERRIGTSLYGRRDRYWNEQIIKLVCRHPERYAERVEFAYVDDAAHFITDDAPDAVADLAIDWFGRAA